MTYTAALVRDYYEGLGLHPRPGATPAELQAFEEAQRLSLPPDVADFYRTINGIEAEVPDFGADVLQLWSLSQLTRVSDGVAGFQGIPDYSPIPENLPDASDYLGFGDGMCWSHVLAVQLRHEAGPVVWISGGSYALMASTFDDFWAQYLANPASML